MNPEQDAPLRFETDYYVQPKHAKFLTYTYLRYDPAETHPFVLGNRPGLWKWESECHHSAVPPTVPPPNTHPEPHPYPPVRPWMVGGPPDIPVGTPNMHLVPGTMYRPQPLGDGWAEMRNTMVDHPDDIVKLNAYAPIVARVEAYAAAIGDHFDYTSRPGESRFSGGTTDGGLVYLPPEMDVTDHATSFAPDGRPASTVHHVYVPGVYVATGYPDVTTGGVKTAYRWSGDTVGDLTFQMVDGSGAATDVLTMTQEGALVSKALAGAPSTPAAGYVSIFTKTDGVYCVLDDGTEIGPFVDTVGGGGYTDEEAQDAVGGILDNGTVGGITFTYDDATPGISGVVKNDHITFARMQNLTSDRLLGRDTAGSGDPEEISLDSTLEFTGSAAIRRAALTGDVTAGAGSNATAIGANKVLDTMLRDSVALSVIGRAVNSGGDPADIVAGANDRVFQRTGDALVFAQLGAGTAPDGLWTNAKLAVAPAWSLKGRNAGSVGAVSDIALADLAVEGSPASGDFLLAMLADGSLAVIDWADLPGGGGTNALLDGTAHSDTVAQTPSKGSLIAGKTTPSALWDELAVGANDLPLVADSGQTLGLAYKVLPIAGGGTGASTSQGAINATSPLTTRGDVIVRDATNTTRLPLGTAGFVLKSDGTDAVWARNYGTTVYVPTAGNTAINNVADQTIATQNVTGVTSGDIVIIEGEFVILNNSGAGRAYTITIDFDNVFDVEVTTASMTASATDQHPFGFRAVCSIRATNSAIATMTVDGQLAAGLASGVDTTMAATHLGGKGWGETTSDLTGTLTCNLKIRSANATATQTCKLVCFEVRKLTAGTP